MLEHRPFVIDANAAARTHVMDVDVDVQAGQVGVKRVQSRPADQRHARTHDLVAGEALQDVEQPDHSLDRAWQKVALLRNRGNLFRQKFHCIRSPSCRGKPWEVGSISSRGR